jgi:hypothetical protein
MHIRSLLWLAGVAGLVPAGAAQSTAAGDGLASFRAVYELTIDDSGGPVASSTAVGGRMVAEFVGSACGGYRSKMRIVTQGEDADGNAQVTDARSDTLETEDGRYEFTNQTYVNNAMAEESTGVASRGAGGITVTLTKPGAKTVALDRKVVFPTEQMKMVLAAATGGQHFVAMDLFDGSEAGDTIYATAAVSGKVSSAPDDFGDDTLIGEAGFGDLPHWPVTVSYFAKGKGTDDAPTYVTSFVVYSNGVGRNLRIDYGKFALNGHLTHLEMLPEPKC